MQRKQQALEFVVSNRKLSLASFWDFSEDEVEQTPENVQAFVVVLVDAHLEIHTGELTQVAMRERFLCAEDGTNFEASLETTARRHHLLVCLRRLRQARVLSEIFEMEDFGASLARFWRSTWQRA